MPELPEVENLRRGLDRALRGRRIRRVAVKRPKLVSGKGNVRPASALKAAEFARRLRGDRVARVERSAKNLIFNLKSGAVVVAHLKMSGQFAYEGKAARGRAAAAGRPAELSGAGLPGKHTHIIFHLDRGTLYYGDPRRFGYVLWYPDARRAREAHFRDVGVEPLGPKFTPRYFRAALRKSGAALKAALTGQRIVAGLGNIYADEACFAAGVRPDRRAGTLAAEEAYKLQKEIKRILRRAVRAGGFSVATYRLLDMGRGGYAREHKVYGRAGEPCVKCGRPLAKTLIQGRTTVFCGRCQR